MNLTRFIDFVNTKRLIINFLKYTLTVKTYDMKTSLTNPGVPQLLTAQSQVAFNDNAAKLLLIGVVQMVLPADAASAWVSAISFLLVLPFVLCAPLAGWLSDRFPKRDVLAGSLWLQCFVMLVIGTGLFFKSLPLAVGGFFLLGLQSSVMGPARRGIVKELAGESIGETVGWMEMLSIVSILVGSLAGGHLVDAFSKMFGNPWSGSCMLVGILAAGCALSVWVFHAVPRQKAASKEPFGKAVLFGHFRLLSTLHKDARLFAAAVGDAGFYFVGGLMLLCLAAVGRELNPTGFGAASTTGVLLAILGAGIAIGSVATATLSRKSIRLELIPVGGLGMAVLLVALSLFPYTSIFFKLALGAAGVFGGMFLVPIGAFLVNDSKNEERGSILAASSMLSSITGLVAVGVFELATSHMHLSLQTIFVFAGLFMGFLAIFSLYRLRQRMLVAFVRLLCAPHYSLEVRGELPKTGGAVLVSNHVSYIDAVLMILAAPRKIRFMSFEGFFKRPVLGTILKFGGAIPVSPNHAKDAIKAAAAAAAAGEVVCIFPEGQLTRTGMLMEFKPGFELIARRANVPVIPVHIGGLWGSIFSFKGGKYFRKWPEGWRRKIVFSFGMPIENNASAARMAIMEQAADSFADYTPLKSLPETAIAALKKSPFKMSMFDQSLGGKSVSRAAVLGLALSLSRKFGFGTERVGVMLPPGVAGTATNLGLMFAGKTPVNLNPLMDDETARHVLAEAGITKVVTSAVLVKKFPNFPFPEQTSNVESLISPKATVIWAAIGVALPTWLLTLVFTKSCPEATLLFTSGTSGKPKGVALTQSNVLSNIAQIGQTEFLQAGDRILSVLPLFHSFGFTVGMLAPIVKGIPVVTAPSPLDIKGVGSAAQKGHPTVIVTTPTFLRTYLKVLGRDKFGALRIVLTGAEKLPISTKEMCQERLGCDVVEGYGMTEASPIVCYNMADPPLGEGADTIQKGSKFGSVGRVLPGVAYKLLNQENQAETSSTNSGILAIKGPNVISGYLGGESSEKFVDGWYVTGDVVEVDNDGFVTIVGRESRFSKIGGEMVSHAAVESVLHMVFPDAQLCVLGRPDPGKGEQLVLLITKQVTVADIKRSVPATLPNLWLPKEVSFQEALPLLPTGKIDVRACKKIVAELPVKAEP